MYCEGVKGECNLGQQEIAFRYARGARAPATTTRSTRTGRRRSPTRTARRSPSWPSSTSARATAATSTCRVRGTDGAPVMAGRRRARLLARSWSTGSPASSPPCASSPALRAHHQLVQALRRRQLRADRGRLGPRQPHVRAARGRPRASLRVENRVPGGDVNPYLAISAIIAGGLHGIENELDSSRSSRATRTHRTSPRAARRCARRRTLRGVGDRRGPRSATTWSSTTSTRRASSWRPTTPPSPTGSGSVVSNGSDVDRLDAPRRRCIGLTTYLEQARPGGVGRSGRVPAQALLRRGDDRRRRRRAAPPPQTRGAGSAIRVLDGLDGSDPRPAATTSTPRSTGTERHPPPTIRARTATRGSCAAPRRRRAANARARHLPGRQLLNVALGGTLHQHLPDALGTTVPARRRRLRTQPRGRRSRQRLAAVVAGDGRRRAQLPPPGRRPAAPTGSS